MNAAPPIPPEVQTPAGNTFSGSSCPTGNARSDPTTRMLHPPQSLLAPGARLLAAWRRRRLALPGHDLRAQHRAIAERIADLAATAYGRAHRISPSMTEAAWREIVPLRAYEGFAAYVERMRAGEADVLHPGRCRYFAVSSGTTAGRTKYLPVTDAMIRHFRSTGLDSLLFFAARTGDAALFGGKHLFLGGATRLAPLPEAPRDAPAYAGDLSGITALHLPGWVEKHLYEPGADIAQLEDWPAKIEAIARRCVDRDIRMVAGIPSWVLILAAAVLDEHARRTGTRVRTLREVWPNFQCLVHGGVPIGPFADELHAVCGAGVTFHEVYPASEGFIAIQDARPEQGLRLLADAGIYYEFLPLTDYDETRLDSLGPKAVPLAEVRVGVDYVLVMTTPAGLTRYIIGDVVRFVSTRPHRLVYAGRTRLQLSAFGEHVIEKELTDALTTVCHRHHWQVVNFHVSPVFVNSMTGQKRGHHEWWIELRPGSADTPTGPLLADELDVELQRLNDDYEAKRKGGGLTAPTVRLVMPGVFEQWQRAAGKWGGQNKMPRCRSDRQIADELAQITRFHDAG